MLGLSRLIALFLYFLHGFLRPAITTVKTTPAPGAASLVEGLQMPAPNVVGLIGNILSNAAPAFGNFALGIYAGGNSLYSAQDIVGGFIRRNGTTLSSDQVDTGTNIVNSIPGAKAGQSWFTLIANLSSIGAITVNNNTGVTLMGTATVDRLSARLFVGQVTGSAAVTMTSAFQFPCPVL